VYVNDIAVSAAGQAVLAGTAGNFDMVLGYRATPTGAWAYNQKMGVAGGPGQPLLDPHVAINETGNAVASYHTTATIFASRRNAFSDWGAVETVAAAGSSESRSVAIDAAGNTYVAFAVGSGGSVSAGAAFRPVGGDWAVQYPLSPQGSTFVAREVTIAIDRAGGAYMSWMQTGPAPADSSINGRSLANGAWGTIERISEMGADFPRTVMTNDGTVLTVWQHDTGADPRSSFARMRSPAGAWGDLRPLSGEYSGYADPHPATDGRHLTVVAAPLVGAVKQVLLSVFDPVAPVVAPIAVSASTTVGGATTLSVTATDEWSAIPTVAWAFGDGATGTGLSTSHAYASAGAYTATVTVTDAAGNATARTIALTIAAAQSTLTTAKFSGKWTASRIKGTLLIKGTAPLAGTYAVDVFSGKTRKLHSAFTPPAGAFAKTIKLPPKLLPGSYRVALTPSFPASQVTPASRTSKLAAPIEGVVSTITLSGTNGGPAARTLRGASTIWVSFRFAAVSRGSLKLTWYRRVKGKRSALGSTTKSPGRKVGSYLRLGGTLLGTFTAVLTRKGKVIAQGSIRAL
jgi:hypothetical protein